MWMNLPHDDAQCLPVPTVIRTSIVTESIRSYAQIGNAPIDNLSVSQNLIRFSVTVVQFNS
jgi:hypothetical protein